MCVERERERGRVPLCEKLGGGRGGVDVLPPTPLPPSLREVPSSGSESRVQSDIDLVSAGGLTRQYA